MAKAKTTTVEISVQDLAPEADSKALTRARSYTAITTAEQRDKATQALQWFKQRIEAIKGNDQFNRLLQKAEEVVDELKLIRAQALKPYVTGEKVVRAEVERFNTAEARAAARLNEENRQKEIARQREEKERQRRTAPTKTVKAKGDVYEFLQAPPPLAVPTVTPPEQKTEGATYRDWWYTDRLVDPAMPVDRDGNPIENREAGIRALAAAVLAGNADWFLLTLDTSQANKLANVAKGELKIPGLQPYFIRRPIIGAGAGASR